MSRRVIDISMPLSPATTVWPGDPVVEIHRVADVADGADATVTRLCTSLHAGTHVDAPMHYFEDGASVTEIDLGVLNGPARVADAIGEASIGEEVLARMGLSAYTERLLLRTSGDPATSVPFDPAFPAVTADGALWLVRLGVRLVGIDRLSIGPYENGDETHRILLAHGVAIVEGLDLHDAADGLYDLVCLPLRIDGVEAAPARALLLG